VSSGRHFAWLDFGEVDTTKARERSFEDTNGREISMGDGNRGHPTSVAKRWFRWLEAHEQKPLPRSHRLLYWHGRGACCKQTQKKEVNGEKIGTEKKGSNAANKLNTPLGRSVNPTSAIPSRHDRGSGCVDARAAKKKKKNKK
jgi:hypothetical protein